MVVVAIIGLLSAVAIPNFKKHQAKARVTEAKLQLSAVYVAESSFFSDFNMYHTCLRYMGYDPDAERASRYYFIGFTSASNVDPAIYQSAMNSGLNPVECPLFNESVDGTANNVPNATFFAAGKGIGNRIADSGYDDEGCLDQPGTYVGTQADADNMTFFAGAYGVISKCTVGNTCSCLRINHNKRIQIHSSGY